MNTTRIKILPIAVWLLLGGVALAADGDGTASQPAATGLAAGAAPLVEGTKSHGTRIAGNFRVLLGRSWDRVSACVKSVTLHALGWSVAGGVFGLALGIALYLGLRRRGLLDVPRPWWRWFRWLWCILFAGCLSGGLLYSGFWYGGARGARHWVEKERIVDFLVLNFHGAIFLDSVNYEATGSETVETYRGLLEDSEEVKRLVEADSRHTMETLAGLLPEDVPMRGWIVAWLGDSARGWVDRVTGMDSRKIFVVLLDHPNLDEYVKGHPGADPAVLALSSGLQGVRAALVTSIRTIAYPHVLAGVVVAFGLPLALLALFHLILWTARKAVRAWRTR